MEFMEYMKKKGGYKKGQAVMEYLITYGLALFVILIVLAILVAVVLPSLRAPETCQFTQPGFTCNQAPHAIVADSANNLHLLFQLDNAQGRAVVIEGVTCFNAATGNIRKSDVEANNALSSPQLMAAGQSLTFGSPESAVTDEISCVNEDGTQTVLSPGSNFRGTLAVTYTFQGDIPGAPERLAVATVTGAVQQE
ncbi:hypothetical protein GF318_02955 [Candidatus Micrarchaeota archaeon]|nr:hypothetical protein [Candidatus Micrarchaeota archaeon]